MTRNAQNAGMLAVGMEIARQNAGFVRRFQDNGAGTVAKQQDQAKILVAILLQIQQMQLQVMWE